MCVEYKHMLISFTQMYFLFLEINVKKIQLGSRRKQTKNKRKNENENERKKENSKHLWWTLQTMDLDVSPRSETMNFDQSPLHLTNFVHILSIDAFYFQFLCSFLLPIYFYIVCSKTARFHVFFFFRLDVPCSKNCAQHSNNMNSAPRDKTMIRIELYSVQRTLYTL